MNTLVARLSRELVTKVTARLMSLKRRLLRVSSDNHGIRSGHRFSDISRAVALATRSRAIIATLAIVAISLYAPTSLHAQTARTLTVTRDLKIDGSTQDFTPIDRLLVGRDGSIAVWQPKDSKILFFDVKGAPLGSVGRKGSGPGEFPGLGVGGLFGDTLWESERNRLTFISPEHKFVRMLVPPTKIKATESDSAGLPISSPMVQAILPDGRLVLDGFLRKTGPRPSWAPPAEQRLPVVLTSSTGVFEKLIGWFPMVFAPECTTSVSTGNMVYIMGTPYCAVSIGDWGRDGSRFATVTQSNPTGVSGHYEVDVASTSGSTVFKRNYTYVTIPVTRHVIDSIITKHTDPKVKQPPEASEAWKAMKYPPTYAPVTRLMVGIDGTIWLELETAGPGHRWQVLSAKGDVVGQVSLPQNFELKAASRNAVWGVEKDQDDLESVVRYKVGQ